MSSRLAYGRADPFLSEGALSVALSPDGKLICLARAMLRRHRGCTMRLSVDTDHARVHGGEVDRQRRGAAADVDHTRALPEAAHSWAKLATPPEKRHLTPATPPRPVASSRPA